MPLTRRPPTPPRVARELSDAADPARLAGAVMSYGDPLDAIDGARSEADEAGHDLRGFTRRTGSFGYRFEARCHTCGETVIVARVNSGWGYDTPIDSCSVQAS